MEIRAVVAGEVLDLRPSWTICRTRSEWVRDSYCGRRVERSSWSIMNTVKESQGLVVGKCWMGEGLKDQR